MALVQRRPSVFDAGPALYRSCTDVLSLLGFNVVTFNEHDKNYVTFNEHDKNYAYFYFIIYAYFNLTNFIMYRPYAFLFLLHAL